MELQARWFIPEEANGMILNYTVTCNGTVMSTQMFDFVGSGIEIGSGSNEISVILVGLVPFTVYGCSVSAATNGGIGTASDASVATTAQDG